MPTVRELFTSYDRLKGRGHSYSSFRAAFELYAAHGERLRNTLPFKTSVEYAYNPNEGASSRGKYHIILQEDVKIGRIARVQGDALCKPRKSFWGLESINEGTFASCVACLERAEKLATVAILEAVNG